nr:hypothetical protein [Tanacetum cinerariifolium]
MVIEQHKLSVTVEFVVATSSDCFGCFDLRLRSRISYYECMPFTVSSLIIEKFDSIPKRLKEDYYSIKDDVLLVSVYTTRNVTVKGIMILNQFLTNYICATPEYKDYEKVFLRVDVLMIQPLLVESTQGTNKTPNAIVDNVGQKKKKKQVIGETSSSRKSLKEKLMEEEIEKMVDDADEEYYASEFVDSVFLNEEEDAGSRLEPISRKENLKNGDDDDNDVHEKNDDMKDDDNDDDDNDYHTDHTLVKTQVTCSSETRKKKMQTQIPSPHKSFRTELSLDNTLSHKLTTTVLPTPDTASQGLSKPTSINTKVILGSIVRMSRQRGKIRVHLKTTFVTNDYF